MVEKKDNEILTAIKTGDAKTLEQVYDNNRQPFLSWAAQTYQCDTEVAIEIYQKAYTILYMNVRNERLTSLTSSIRTYLFSIGKNLFRERVRDRHYNMVNLDDVENISVLNKQVDTNVLDRYQDNYQKELVRQLLDEIGDPCQTLLKLTYIQGYAAEAVAKAMNYSDERVVRKRKSLCLKKLRTMMAEKKDSNLL